MNSITKMALPVILLMVMLSGCMAPAPVKTGPVKPEELTVYADGTMEFRNRKMDEKDVIIYNDGRGGEKAAVKISLEPLHPPFFRDSIVVVRKPEDPS